MGADEPELRSSSGSASATAPLDDAVLGGSATPARATAAEALRRLSHAIVSHELDDELLAQVSASVAGLEAAIAPAPARRRAVDVMKRDIFAVAPPDGGVRHHFPDCIVSGSANPMGVAARVWRDGDEGVLAVTLGAAFEGAPGRAHGGVVAALFDEVMGFVLSIVQTPAYTGRLSVEYKAPTPLGVELCARARLIQRQGRKLVMRGELQRAPGGAPGDNPAGTPGADRLIAQAEGLFISVDPERFATGNPG